MRFTRDLPQYVVATQSLSPTLPESRYLGTHGESTLLSAMTSRSKRSDLRLLDELDAAAAYALLRHPPALAPQEDHRRVFDLGADHRTGGVGDAGAERGDAQGRPACHPGVRFGHEADRELVVRRDDLPSTLLSLDKEVNEVGVGNPKQRVDALGLEEL